MTDATLENLKRDLEMALEKEQEARQQAESLLDNKHSELSSRNRELSEKADELARSNADLQQFAYVVSHDLQAPLRNIISFTKLLQRELGDDLSESASEYMEFISEAVRQMTALIEDILQLSRVSNKGNPFEDCELQRVVSEAVSRHQELIRETGASVEFADPQTVHGDATQLTQLFQNLIGNAIKFRDEQRAPAIRISSSETDGRVEIRVADNGIGIPEEHHSRIFGVFTRLHTRDQIAGTGIGLSIVRKIVERHDGEIHVESKVGEGSTFIFTLPKAKSPA